MQSITVSIEELRELLDQALEQDGHDLTINVSDQISREMVLDLSDESDDWRCADDGSLIIDV